MFLSLISGCTIDWYQKWPEDARIAVAQHYLKDFHIECTEKVKERVIKTTSFIHNHIFLSCAEYLERYGRQTYVTSKTLLSFLECFKKLYREKHNYIITLEKRMLAGIAKMIEAGQSVGILKAELVEKVAFLQLQFETQIKNIFFEIFSLNRML